MALNVPFTVTDVAVTEVVSTMPKILLLTESTSTEESSPTILPL